MDASKSVRQALAESAKVKQALLRREGNTVVRAAKTVVAAYRKGGKAMFFGNGGSAADAQHAAAELVGRYAKNRPGLPALALHADTSILTALGNDFGYDQVFAHQVQAWGRRGDVAIGISTSGRSPNVVKALVEARRRGITAIALTGDGGGEAAANADIAIRVPTRVTARIQECHIAILHTICQAVEESLFPDQKESHHRAPGRRR